MSQIQFPNETHPDSKVFSTKGLTLQLDNSWNGQMQTATTGEVYGVGVTPTQYDQCHGQHNENTPYSYGNPYAGLQNQRTQTNTFGTSNNIAGVRTIQGTKGAEEVLRQIHYVYGPPETYYPSSEGAPFPSGVSVSSGPVAYPETSGTVETAGISFGDHFNFDLQAGSAFTNGLVSPLQEVANNTYSNQTAYSSSVYLSSYYHAWAMQPDLSTFGTAAQTVAPRMNTVTPSVVYCNDRGRASAGAAVCVIAPAPGPTPNTNDNARDMHPKSTASTYSPRDTESGGHRSRQRTHAPKEMGNNWTHRGTSTPRGVPPGRAQMPKSPTVPYEADIDILATRLLDEGAPPATIEVLRKQVFNNGITERALTAKFIQREPSTNHSRVKRKYLLLLEHSSKGYRCRLCPQDRPVKYKNSQDSLRHLRKVHFGLALICHCRCGRKFYRQSEMNQHLRKRNGLVPMSAGKQSEVHHGSDGVH